MKCMICGKSLYENIDFRTLFKLNYTTHIECDIIYDVEVKTEIIPIENNQIEYWYFYHSNLHLNGDYLFLKYGYKFFVLLQNTSDWSVCLYNDASYYFSLPDIDQYLLLKLAVNKLVFFDIYEL